SQEPWGADNRVFERVKGGPRWSEVNLGFCLMINHWLMRPALWLLTFRSASLRL
ncbi:uncharacterized, partial [Tachysurus ichikawai]